MKLKLICDDTRGATLVEFTVTLPFFLLLMFGLVQAGLLLYTLNGLQHGVEVAARCASVNYSAYQLGLSQSCFGTAVAPSAVTGTTIQQYAAQNSWGTVPSSTWTINCPNSVTSGCTNSKNPTNTCDAAGTLPGYTVTVQYSYNLINYIFQPLTLTATSCFPINLS